MSVEKDTPSTGTHTIKAAPPSGSDIYTSSPYTLYLKTTYPSYYYPDVIPAVYTEFTVNV